MEQRRAEEEMEERVQLSVLYDFYGALLKENQRRMFEASILEDYNFAEIAEEEGISRQGAYDAIKRAGKPLYDYENKLGLAAKFQKQKKSVQDLKEKLSEMNVSWDSAPWQAVLRVLEEILED